MGYFADLGESLRAFTPQERRNIAIYIAGIMVYKFGLEAFNGSIIALASNRYDYEALRDGTPSRTFERVGLLTGLNQACQCIGSILIGPLVSSNCALPSPNPSLVDSRPALGKKIPHQERSLCCHPHFRSLLGSPAHHRRRHRRDVYARRV